MTEKNTEQAPDSTPPKPFSDAFVAFIPQGWAPYPAELPGRLPAAEHTAPRRDAVAAAFPGERLVIPAGGLRTRSNDTDYGFRPHSAFAHLTGLGADREPDAVLVIEPTPDGHVDTLYFRPRAPRTDPEFYADHRYGEMWVGQRESLDEMSALTGLTCAPASELVSAVTADAAVVRIVRGVDERLQTLVDAARAARGVHKIEELDAELERCLSELRLVKDAFEIEELQRACDDTAVAFEAVVRDLPHAVDAGRGERWVEGVFGLHARHRGNAVGYDTIAASGDHACTLHWIRNDGDLSPDDLILLDAGIERDSLYTADVTRTLPISGRFTPAQRKVYEAVLDAQAAGFAAAKPGATFIDVHNAAVRVIAERLHEWGLLPVPVEESLDPHRGGQHRRWMVHGTSHHLGLDVHDCAQARNEYYRQGTIKPGMVFTVEPGLYFKATDELVPADLRGIGVRIEDDIVITDDGYRILSDKLPRTVDDIESWMASLLDGGRD
ncbi:aminopeptidase P family protein [Propioniciclava tarda]|uniref:Xaa-Pro aminopeptidase n=1 Tax=Propioniciclava tarda TaxID=433330 RepID=A0A4Q9KIU5_PROTD|nr:aminopeptidase P family protein [Propioniciclava tarda]TBT94298.1 aminopeptidase P family protein [Propioniciclava tarda]SMO73921.1 Xaa-Pro aminopeptidase [Propioniciclava tarda]